MNSWGRALFGAAVGSLGTLFLHPASRPFMTGVATWASPTAIHACVNSNTSQLAAPRSLSDASLWMQLAAHRIATRRRLTPQERNTVLMIAEAAAAKQRVNAFWPLVESIVYYDAGDFHGAVNAWMRASACSTWDDFQSKRLLTARALMVRRTGIKQSWQLAYLYYARSDDVASCLRPVARAILSRSDYNTAQGLTVRYATLLNGDLIIRFAHSTKLSVAAMDIIDLATYPSESVPSTYSSFMSPKKLWTGQLKVIDNLIRILHEPDWAHRAQGIFQYAESVRALTVHDSSEENTERLALASVVCASISGAIVVLAVIGAVIWCAGRMVSWRLAREKDVKPVLAAAIALAFGGLVEVLTAYWPAALVSVLCAGFLIVAPDRSRKARSEDLGPMFEFMAMFLGLICSALLLIYLVGTTLAADAVFPSLGIPSEFFDRPLFAGLAAVCFGLVLLVAPIWAVVHRLGTPHVLSLILMRLGRFVAVAALFLSIVLGPLAVYTDRHLETIMGELVENEPMYYYINR